MGQTTSRQHQPAPGIETFDDALPADIHHLAAAVMTGVCERNLMVGVAESCTGGLLAAVLTDVEGASHGFDRGFVVYTDQAKNEVLGVPMEILETDGAVSAPAASAMADGVLRASRADVVLSITGFAGPGGPGEEPGLVYFGVARRDGPRRTVERRFGDVSRAEVRRQCLRVGMGLVSELLVGLRQSVSPVAPG